MSRSAAPTKRSAADAQEQAWVADEDRFVLQQAKKKAALRVKGGRAQPIDWLAVTLAVIDSDRNPLDDEIETDDLDLMAPESVLEGLSEVQLMELEKGIETYLVLEKGKSNHDYWMTMKTICENQRQHSNDLQTSARGVSAVASDLDKLLGPKNLAQLEKLEGQVETKLSSNEPIDTDYWEHLLHSLLTYKARAKLRSISQSILDSRLGSLRKQQSSKDGTSKDGGESANTSGDASHLESERSMPMTEEAFALRLAKEREKVQQQGFIPSTKRLLEDSDSVGDMEPTAKRLKVADAEQARSAKSAFDREVSRGLGENEEIFTAEEEVVTKNRAQWADKHRPRKPKYFNRVQNGYEWNKYNQTHYDHENPPPKVVQGYKFNIFYPDLVDKLKAPTYKIEREGGRRRGETLAPAGEDDTCIIRFVAGAPYEDLAFRIVDKEWDYSAKRERGFRSSFDKGILQLHFQFKKIYYRK